MALVPKEWFRWGFQHLRRPSANEAVWPRCCRKGWAAPGHARIPFRVGQVLVGDDPFNGRRLGTVAVIEAPYVGLRTAGGAPQDIVFYDYRQLRYPD